MSPASRRSGGRSEGTSPVLLHEVASLYYLDEITQAEIAERLGMSRPGVSRLLAEARRRGIVRIEIPPLLQEDREDLTEELREALDLRRVILTEPSPPEVRGSTLAQALASALRDMSLRRGSVLILSTGRTIFETIHAHVPELPGVVVVPSVGGQGEPEAWYAANELTRRFAQECGGHPEFLFAPSLPGAHLYETLLHDPSTSNVIDLWRKADCAVLGIGSPPSQRKSIASDIPLGDPALNRAVGDVCLHFFDLNGEPVSFPGSDRVIGTPVSTLREIPHAIALATGSDKAPSIIGAARGGYINELITDSATAVEVLDLLDRTEPVEGSTTT